MTDTRAASCMPDACFCEAIRAHGFAQPANAWSSLAFVAVAIAILVAWSKDRHIASQPVYPILLAFTLLVVGLGSAFFHATLSFTGQFFDVLGMYLIATFALLYGIDRLGRLGNQRLIATYLVTNVILAAVLLRAPAVRRIVFGALIVGVLGVEMAVRKRRNQSRSRKRLNAAILSLAIGFTIWVLDYTKIMCSPESWIQGHALWHFLGALSAWYLYLYYQDDAQAVEHSSHA